MKQLQLCIFEVKLPICKVMLKGIKQIILERDLKRCRLQQYGKTTLAKHIIGNIRNSLYLDLESNRDLRKLNDPETFFEDNSGSLICIDEIQRRPDLFASLRSIVDRQGGNCRILLLGSALFS